MKPPSRVPAPRRGRSGDAPPSPAAPSPTRPPVPPRSSSNPPSSSSTTSHDDGSLRLSKRMSELGIASRREADEWIARGWVRVDGRVVAELGSRVLPSQHITIDARARNAQAQLVTVLLNKPVGYVSGQAEDGYQPARVLVTPDRQWREDSSGIRFLPQHLRSLVPAGRLDIDSVGLLVLTQDGRVARQLIGDDSTIEKEYLVRVATRSGAPLPAEATGAAAPRARARRRGASAGDGRMGQRRPAALRPAGRQEAPDPAHVRGGRPAGARPEARSHRRGHARRAAAGAVALPAPRRALRRRAGALGPVDARAD